MIADRTVRIVRNKIPREEVQEEPRSSGPTPSLQETGYQPNRRKEKEDMIFLSYY
jgi:hypothetical protein